VNWHTGNSDTVEDRQRGIMRQALAQPLPQLIFAATQIGGLAHEDRAMESA
jgi:hypothetical protein